MRIAILPLLALASLVALPAAAQLNPLDSTTRQPGGMKQPTDTGKPVIPPPEAVPGARPRPDSVTPLTRGTTDLPPTEALFDAINRGDIATARDAINRGADLDSTNLLGLTPIELSVDLGRNDISFLLLSLRGAGGAGAAPVQQAATAPGLVPRKKPPAQVVKAVTREAPPGPARAPALVAGNGGAPVPSAGFLGFDPHR